MSCKKESRCIAGFTLRCKPFCNLIHNNMRNPTNCCLEEFCANTASRHASFNSSCTCPKIWLPTSLNCGTISAPRRACPCLFGPHVITSLLVGRLQMFAGAVLISWRMTPMGCPTLCLSSAPLLVYSVQLHSLLAAETSLGSCSSNVSPGAPVPLEQFCRGGWCTT